MSTGLCCEASLLLLITAAVLMLDILDSLDCPESDTVAVPILAAGHGTAECWQGQHAVLGLVGYCKLSNRTWSECCCWESSY